MSLILKAAKFAREKHAGTFRKHSIPPKPYFTHVAAVAGRVAGWAEDDETVAAAFLHDVIEDCKVTYEELADKFGEKVADIVLRLTNPSKVIKAPRQIRKQMDAEHMEKQPPVVQRIKMEDRCHNLEEIVNGPRDWILKYLDESENLISKISPEVDPPLRLQILLIIKSTRELLHSIEKAA